MPFGLSQLTGFNVAAAAAPAGPPADTEWKLSFTTTTPSEAINIILGGTVNCHITWGDDSSNDYTTTGLKAHTYATAGTYTVGISGVLGSIDLYNIGSTMRAKFKAIVNKISNLSGFTTFHQAFKQTGLTGSLPAGLFDHGCAGVTSFFECFADATGITGLLPAGLFANCPAVTTFTSVFQGLSGVTGAIPGDLFGTKPSCTSYKWAFRNTHNSGAIPAALFAGSPAVNDFTGTFLADTAFHGYTYLPPTLFDAQAGVSSFLNCFYNQSNMTGGEAIPLWNRTTPTPDGTNCYENCTGLSNFNDIPAGWK